MRRFFAGVGIIALLASFSFVATARAQDTASQQCHDGDVCICTGSPNGDYQKAGEEISKQLGGNLNGHRVVLITTHGSGDNLNFVATGKRCQMGLAQSDVFALWKTDATNSSGVATVQPLYTEYTHILCPAVAKIDNLAGLSQKHATLIIGPPGSGTEITWRSLRDVDAKYDTKTINVSPEPVDSSSIQEVKTSTATRPVCVLWIAGLNSIPMQNANLKSVNPENGEPLLQLISVDDKRMLRLPGLDGPRYAVKEISPKKNYYDHLINNGGFFSSASVDVLTIPALLIINKSFKDDLSNNQRSVWNRLTDAVGDAAGVLTHQMSPGG